MTEEETLIEADSLLFSNLLREGRFSVPWHQRYYDWKPDDNVWELLSDINEAVREKRDCYFLGTVIFVKKETGHKETKHWEINDGQQRMITFSLTCAALCRKFAHDVPGSQREGMALRILFELDENTPPSLDDALNYTPRISPQEDDATCYNQIIRGNDIGTNGIITAAWKKIDGFVRSQSPEESRNYFDFLLQRIEIVRLLVPSEVDPNAVYETINCRGKILDDLDLIRNHIYSHFNADKNFQKKNLVHKNLETIHTYFSGKVRGERASQERTSQYMRCHLQCIFGFLHKDNFYRDVRKAMKDRTQAKRISLADCAFYLTEKVADSKSLALFAETVTSPSPDPDFVQPFNVACNKTNSKRNLVVLLQELRGYSVTQPLVFALLTAYLRETENGQKRRTAKIVYKNLSRLSTLVLRTAFVTTFQPSHFEVGFSSFAKKIMQSKEVPDEEFAKFLKDCDRENLNILNNRSFREKLSKASMKGAPKIKQFLLGINSDHQNSPQVVNDRQLTIEHILPRSKRHWNGWEGFHGSEPSEWIYRIGNLTLLVTGEDKPGDKDNANFAEKKEVYRNSSFIITRRLANYDDWTPQNIDGRQSDMVRRAIEVWKFP